MLVNNGIGSCLGIQYRFEIGTPIVVFFWQVAFVTFAIVMW
jgi:hypothetical protein